MVAIFDKSNFDFEDFDEEIVLIQIQSGIYYTLKGSGPAILRLFQEGYATEDVSDYLAKSANGEWLREVEVYIEQLLTEGILVRAEGLSSSQPDLTSLSVQEKPVLEKFDDVSDLIKLDPIHDVSDLGWPHKK
ncbi:PqqD family protein [Spirosoma aerolatum]|uniref:PqqD family protein n=1 Tax=Spirosoma aerolatum TaxID=1211326 RepID=UPI0009ACE830|nr:PqqD family peptide modification chaperone [Spirosoma aerolatum]